MQKRDLPYVAMHLPLLHTDPNEQLRQFPSKSTLRQNYGYAKQALSLRKNLGKHEMHWFKPLYEAQLAIILLLKHTKVEGFRVYPCTQARHLSLLVSNEPQN